VLLFIVIINLLMSKVAPSSFVAIFWNRNCSPNKFEFVSVAMLDFFWHFLMILGIHIMNQFNNENNDAVKCGMCYHHVQNITGSNIAMDYI
jgi:hypothetical protein